MKRLLSTLSCVPVALTAMVILAPSASAEERQCRGAIGAVTLDNVHVPDGATCTLNGTSLKGSLTIGRGATLTAKSVKVIGNIQSEVTVTLSAGQTVYVVVDGYDSAEFGTYILNVQ